MTPQECHSDGETRCREPVCDAPPSGGWTTFLLAGCLSALITYLAVHSSEQYYAKSTHHYDSVSYRSMGFSVRNIYEARGVSSALAFTLKLKDGLDLSLRALLWPESLSAFYGHLVVGVPALMVFLWTLMLYVYRKTQSHVTSLLTGGALLLFPIVYHPIHGFGDFWKDNIGIWLLCGACCSWLLSNHLQDRRWGGFAGVLLGLLVMQRTTLAVYGAFLFAPVFLWGAVRAIRGRGVRTALLDCLAFAGPALALAAFVAIMQWNMLYNYYFVSGYGYISRSEVPKFIRRSLRDTGLTYLGTMVFAYAVWRLVATTIRKQPRTDLLLAVWWCVALPLGWVLTKATYPLVGNAWTPLWVMLIGVAIPVGLAHRRSWQAGLLVLLVFGANLQYQECARYGRQLGLINADRKKLYDDIALFVYEHDKNRPYGLFFDECGGLPSSQLVLQKGEYLPLPTFFMSVHDSYYKARFQDDRPGPLARRTIRQMEGVPGALAFSFCNPEHVWNNLNFIHRKDNPPIGAGYSQVICRHLQRDPHWRVLKFFASKDYGPIAVFEYSPEPLTLAQKWELAPEAEWIPPSRMAQRDTGTVVR